jgi:HD-like signal output (HDOD) protein
MATVQPLELATFPTAAPEGAMPQTPPFVKDLTVELLAGDVRLPSFPDIVVRLQRILEDPTTQPEQIARVIAADAALAARILRLANSAFLNPTTAPVTDLRHAVTRLGQQLVRCTAVAFALHQMKFGGRSVELRPKLQAIWRVGMLVAAISHVIARETRAANPDEAMLTGLMHNIGRLYITVHTPTGEMPNERVAVTPDVMNEWHPRCAASILKLWKFPSTIITAVANQTMVERPPGIAIGLTNVLMAAVALVPAVFRRDQVDEVFQNSPAFGALGLDLDDCRRILVASAQPIRSLQTALHN